MRTLLEQPMRRSDFLKLGFAVAGAFFLCPYHRWEGTPLADAAEDTGAHGGRTEETIKVYSVEKKEYITVGKVVKADTEWKKMLEFEQYCPNNRGRSRSLQTGTGTAPSSIDHEARSSTG